MAWDENSYPGYQRNVYQFPGASTFVEYVRNDSNASAPSVPDSFTPKLGGRLIEMLVHAMVMIGAWRS
jgi:hypothetical protein